MKILARDIASGHVLSGLKKVYSVCGNFHSKKIIAKTIREIERQYPEWSDERDMLIRHYGRQFTAKEIKMGFPEGEFIVREPELTTEKLEEYKAERKKINDAEIKLTQESAVKIELSAADASKLTGDEGAALLDLIDLVEK